MIVRYGGNDSVNNALLHNDFTRYIQHMMIRRMGFNLGKLSRAINNTHNDYAEIKRYKNIHSGERCFILATGPSLTIDDVRKLKTEYTFGMNSICLLFDELGWETTYYGVQDYNVYDRLKTKYKQLKSTVLFLGDGISKQERSEVKHIPFALDYLNHKYTYDKLMTKFSRDAYQQIFDGYTITYSLIQLAVYMGFEKIYLLGNDCSYPKDPTKQHFMDFGHYDPSTLTARDRILFAYQYAFDYLKETNIRIYNATRGGELEIFPRVDLDEVLQK